jgi:hypothetical protein
MNNTQIKALLASYGRSVLGAAVALYLSGVTDPIKLLAALAAGLLPVAIRFFNPKDVAFGKVAEIAKAEVLAVLPKGEAIIPKEYLDANKEAIENLVKTYNDINNAQTKKAPAKKPVAKKPTDPKAPKAV